VVMLIPVRRRSARRDRINVTSASWRALLVAVSRQATGLYVDAAHYNAGVHIKRRDAGGA
jgi:hypothetical protein